MNLLDLMVTVSVDDKASTQIAGISSGVIAKATAIVGALEAIESAASAAFSAISSFMQGALSAYGTYEQQVGGMQTFFGDAAQTVIQNAQNAYQTAGMSANQYMSNVSGFAMSLVQGVTKQRQTNLQADTSAQKAALDSQVSNLQKALAKEYSARQKAYSDQLNQRSEQLSDELDNLRKNLTKQTNERRKALQEEVSDFQKATSERIKEINREYREKLKLTNEEEYERLEAIDKQIEALNGQTDAERKAKKQREQSEKEYELRIKMLNADSMEEKLKAQQDYEDLMSDIAQEAREEQRSEQVKQLKQEQQNIKDEYSKKREALQEQQQQEVDQYTETRSKELKALQESNEKKLEKIQEHNEKVLKEKQRSNEHELKEMRDSQQQQLEALKDSQDAQVEAMRNSVAAQKAALDAAAANQEGYTEATEEELQRAAELADIAMRDMADNANKTGSSIESLQYAYQGFAKQNYTMLDNLKLGYAGTNEGMENLLADAEKVQQKYGIMADYSVDSFADIVEAIHVMQVEMGISGLSTDELKDKMANMSDFTNQELGKLIESWGLTGMSIDDFSNKLQGNAEFSQGEIAKIREAWEKQGHSIEDVSGTLDDLQHHTELFSNLLGTTALEGSTTYEGSINRVKAAWENWLTSLSDPDWDVADSTRILMEEVGNAAAIIVPRVAEIIGELLKEIELHGPEIVETVKNSFMESLPEEWRERLEGFGDKFNEFIEGIQPIIDVLSAIGGAFRAVGEVFTAVGQTLGSVFADIQIGAEGLEGGTNEVFTNIGGFIRGFEATMLAVPDAIGQVVEDLLAYFDNLGRGIEIIVNDVRAWFENLPHEIEEFFDNAPDILFQAGRDIINGLWNGLQDAWTSASEWVSGIGDWIAQHKGPRQYDLNLLRPNGRWIVQGLETGMRESFPLIERVVGDLTDMMSVGSAGTFASSGVTQPRTGGDVNIYMTYNAGEDGTTIVEDMARQLRMYGYNLGVRDELWGAA